MLVKITVHSNVSTTETLECHVGTIPMPLTISHCLRYFLQQHIGGRFFSINFAWSSRKEVESIFSAHKRVTVWFVENSLECSSGYEVLSSGRYFTKMLSDDATKQKESKNPKKIADCISPTRLVLVYISRPKDHRSCFLSTDRIAPKPHFQQNRYISPHKWCEFQVDRLTASSRLKFNNCLSNSLRFGMLKKSSCTVWWQSNKLSFWFSLTKNRWRFSFLKVFVASSGESMKNLIGCFCC